jgi:hypothetical protein
MESWSWVRKKGSGVVLRALGRPAYAEVWVRRVPHIGCAVFLYVVGVGMASSAGPRENRGLWCVRRPDNPECGWPRGWYVIDGVSDDLVVEISANGKCLILLLYATKCQDGLDRRFWDDVRNVEVVSGLILVSWYSKRPTASCVQ